MRPFIILFLVVIAAAFTVGALEADKKWTSYKEQFNKHYPSKAEEEYRKKIFLENKKTIDEHNAKYEKGEVPYKMGLNKFSDWTHKEFVDAMLGASHNAIRL